MSNLVKGRIRITFIPSHKYYLVLTVKGLDFVNKWFSSNEHIPANLTKLYQILLRIARLDGVVDMLLAIRLGYGKDIINKAISNKYLEISHTRKASVEVNKFIKAMYGKPPETIYV